jgi:hypothetical protein
MARSAATANAKPSSEEANAGVTVGLLRRRSTLNQESKHGFTLFRRIVAQGHENVLRNVASHAQPETNP